MVAGMNNSHKICKNCEKVCKQRNKYIWYPGECEDIKEGIITSLSVWRKNGNTNATKQNR